MFKATNGKVTPAMFLRIFADVLMVQFSLLTAISLTWFCHVLLGDLSPDKKLSQHFWIMIGGYADAAWPLTLICVAVFYLNGFYTYGRFYQGRYKALIVLQAVCQSYLIYGCVHYGFQLGELTFSRTAFVISWILTAVLLIGSRVWLHIWKTIADPERDRVLSARRGQGKNVLVIGGAGYIGSALLPKLLASGYRVRLLDLLLYDTEPIDSVLGHPNLEVVQGDFRHVGKIVEVMQDIDSVVHLGAIVGDPACELDRELTTEVNLSATRMVAEVARLCGVERFVFASTCSVYGACDEVLDERSNTRPVSHYGNTKLAAERVLRQMADDRFAPTILRFSTIYGLSGRTRFDLVVNLLTAKAKIDGQITVMGGNQWRPFVHVDDAALSVATVLAAPRELVGNEMFNVGCDAQNYTIKQIGEIVHQHVPGAELIIDEKDTDRRNYRVSFAKICNYLNFEPQWTLERGIEQVLEAIARGDITDYRDAKYSNVKFLSTQGTERLSRSTWAHEMLKEITSS
ncbi:MAG TPA: NAD-dependent epimerase/dehydratase [Pirellulales bacterium]|jgi:nucleoside-diphosphate-sugar epimerase|nr:NAD-dependent epimerase/dehydratase [Pirellulales bacterium]